MDQYQKTKRQQKTEGLLDELAAEVGAYLMLMEAHHQLYAECVTNLQHIRDNLHLEEQAVE